MFRCRSVVVLWVIGALLLACLPAAHARQVKTKRLAKGVIYRVYREKHPRLRIKTVTVAPQRVGSIRAVLGSGRLPGWERTSSIARRTRAIAAINGDYGRPSGRPVMAFGHAARLLQTPLAAGKNFAVTSGQAQATIGFPRPKIWLNANGTTMPVGRLNNGGPYGNSFAMFDRAGGKLEKPPKRACSVRLKSSGIPRPDSERTGMVARYRVDRVKCTKGQLFPMGGRVISARWKTGKAEAIKSLTPGSVVSLGWSLGFGPIRETVGGNPTLIENGRVVVEKSRAPFFARHPRTGVGVTKGGAVVMATVDGRQRRSVGMTLRGFALFFRGLGAETALNLDGGGSTTMVVGGRVMNRPSDGPERPVSSALVVVHKGANTSKTSRSASVRSEGRPAETWEVAAEDPGSVGGLADALSRSGVRLDGSLNEAARRLRRSTAATK